MKIIRNFMSIKSIYFIFILATSFATVSFFMLSDISLPNVQYLCVMCNVMKSFEVCRTTWNGKVVPHIVVIYLFICDSYNHSTRIYAWYQSISRCHFRGYHGVSLRSFGHRKLYFRGTSLLKGGCNLKSTHTDYI